MATISIATKLLDELGNYGELAPETRHHHRKTSRYYFICYMYFDQHINIYIHNKKFIILKILQNININLYKVKKK